MKFKAISSILHARNVAASSDGMLNISYGKLLILLGDAYEAGRHQDVAEVHYPKGVDKDPVIKPKE